jgi:phosphotriesterase-related protein
VDSGPLSEIDRKLIAAAALCHRETGLRIAAHTGDGAAAMDVIRALAGHGAGAEAYVWVHAQNEKNRAVHVDAAKAGAWIEFDGVGPKTLEGHVSAVVEMIAAGFIGQLMVSQDSGWYHVGEPGGGQFNGYTYLFETFIPALRARGVTERQVRQLLAENPARALAGVRR